MATIKDRRGKAIGGGMKRKVTAITHIALHWTVSNINATTADFERHWQNTLGWGTGGYHEVVLRDGTVELNYDPDTITNGVGDHNSYTYHISYVANPSQPMTDAQRKTIAERVKYWVDKLANVKGVDNLLGHNEFANTPRFNHSSNQCPGINMSKFRADLKENKTPVVEPKPAPQQPSRPNSSRPVKDGQTLHLPASAETWRIYRPEGGYQAKDAIHQLTPAAFGGLTYEIKGSPAQDVYLIDTGVRGRVAIYAGANTSARITGTATKPTQSKRKKLHLPASADTWRIYRVGGSYKAKDAIHMLTPSRFGGLTYDILNDLGGGVYEINTSVRGRVAIYAGNDTSARITNG